MGVGDAHDDPLDDVDVGEDADVEEGGAGGIDALEREKPPPAAAVDHRKDGTRLAPIRTTTVSWTAAETPSAASSVSRRRAASTTSSGARQKDSLSSMASNACLKSTLPPVTTKSGALSRRERASARRAARTRVMTGNGDGDQNKHSIGFQAAVFGPMPNGQCHILSRPLT